MVTVIACPSQWASAATNEGPKRPPNQTSLAAAPQMAVVSTSGVCTAVQCPPLRCRTLLLCPPIQRSVRPALATASQKSPVGSGEYQQSPLASQMLPGANAVAGDGNVEGEAVALVDPPAPPAPEGPPAPASPPAITPPASGGS